MQTDTKYSSGVGYMLANNHPLIPADLYSSQFAVLEIPGETRASRMAEGCKCFERLSLVVTSSTTCIMLQLLRVFIEPCRFPGI